MCCRGEGESTENRTLIEKPVFSADTIDEFPSQYSAYYEDNIPFKQNLVFAYNAILFKIFNDSGVESVVLGNDGWLFYNSEAKMDGSTLTEYKRTKVYDEEELQNIINNTVAQKEYIESLGMDFVLLIVPNKEEVYSQYMPKEIKRCEGDASCDVLVERLKNAGINVVYPKELMVELAENDESVRLYRKYDTHWNALGAVVATQELERIICGKPLVAYTSYGVSEYSNIGDLSKMLNIAQLLEPEEQYIVPEYQLNDGTFYEKDNVIPKKVFLVGDSFRKQLGPFLASDFQNVEVEERSALQIEQLINSGADIVILEYAERRAEKMGEFSFQR